MNMDFERPVAGDAGTAPRHAGRGEGAAAPPAALVARSRTGLDVQRRCTIRVERRYAAPPARIFDAWLDPAIAGQWLFATASQPMAVVELDARVGGAFRLADRRGGSDLDFAGRYLEIVQHRRLAFRLRSPRYVIDSRVVVDLAPQGTVCTLALTHDGLARDDAQRLENRWTGILYGLGTMLDAFPRMTHTTRSRR
jgi:uncharacterized protein YndB with AHSA1/START domain